ncbi:glycine zipper 2TM domain-containing protein [Comamonas composti]|uniref:glycine zipper 2TM domain-containing protein n=1 Tax=Comamonas composti TaxID=408558 RepID=UPI0005529205|nr:glycine zipper 2TM domain-containing protein [Comamonas composti]
MSTPRTLLKSLTLMGTLAGALALGGCAHHPNNAQIGTGVGAVAGGVVGNALFGSTLGTVGGAAAGALIGNQVGSDSDNAGRRGRRR